MPRRPRPTIEKLDEDPVVADVRRWRAELMKEAGGTLKGLLDLVYGKQRNGKATEKQPKRRAKSKKAASRA